MSAMEVAPAARASLLATASLAALFPLTSERMPPWVVLVGASELERFDLQHPLLAPVLPEQRLTTWLTERCEPRWMTMLLCRIKVNAALTKREVAVG